MNAAVYLRQSLDRQGDGLAIARQRAGCRDLVERRQWTVVREFVDNDVSASSGRRRPAYEAMLDAIRAGEIKAVVVWDLDRLTRRPTEIEEFIDLADQHGIALASVGGDADLATDNGRLFARIKGAVARAEVERKGRRQRAAVEQAAQAGKRVGGRRPFGYEPDGTTIREAEARALRRAYDSVIHEVPLAEIARELNADGFATPQFRRTYVHGCDPACNESTAASCPARKSAGERSPWYANTLRPVLLSPRYAGWRSRVDVEMLKVDEYRKNPPKARIDGIVRGEDGRPVKAAWPAIVSEEIWESAKAVLTDPSRTNARRSGVAMLTGIAVCGVCGAPVIGGRASGNSLRAKVYRCRASRGHIARAQEPIDQLVEAHVVELLSRPDATDLLHDEDVPEAGLLRAEAAKLEVRRRVLATDYADGVLTRDQLRAGTERIAVKVREIERQLADAARVHVLGGLVGAEDVAAVWESLTIDRRRPVIDLLFSVKIGPAGRGTRTFRPETISILDRRESTVEATVQS